MNLKMCSIAAVPAFALILASCGEQPGAVAEVDDAELAEDASDGTVADEMDSGAPEIREGGGRAVGKADNPNEPVVPDDGDQPETDPAEVR